MYNAAYTIRVCGGQPPQAAATVVMAARGSSGDEDMGVDEEVAAGGDGDAPPVQPVVVARGRGQRGSAAPPPPPPVFYDGTKHQSENKLPVVIPDDAPLFDHLCRVFVGAGFLSAAQVLCRYCGDDAPVAVLERSMREILSRSPTTNNIHRPHGCVWWWWYVGPRPPEFGMDTIAPPPQQQQKKPPPQHGRARLTYVVHRGTTFRLRRWNMAAPGELLRANDAVAHALWSVCRVVVPRMCLVLAAGDAFGWANSLGRLLDLPDGADDPRAWGWSADVQRSRETAVCDDWFVAGHREREREATCTYVCA